MEYVVLIIGLCAAGFFALFLIFRRLINRWIANAAQLDTIRDEVGRMLVELNRTTGENIDLIEARVGQLREFLGTVDKRIALYRRETGKVETGKNVYNSIIRNKPVPAPERIESEIITTISLRDKVLNLYHAGFTSAMIANQLQSTVGEVELIIALAEKE
jgi:hypothetical protein